MVLEQVNEKRPGTDRDHQDLRPDPRLLEDANLALEVLRFPMRLAKDLQCLKVESYGFAAKSIDEIGRLVEAGSAAGPRRAGHEATRESLGPDDLVRHKSVVFPCEKGIRFLKSALLGFRPEGAATCQPRATPWELENVMTRAL